MSNPPPPLEHTIYMVNLAMILIWWFGKGVSFAMDHPCEHK